MAKKEKQEKQVRNKFRDGLGDYFLTNQKIDKDERERAANAKGSEKRENSAREKAMIIVILLLIAVIALKSIVLDPVRNLTPEEEDFKDFVLYTVEESYQSKLKDMGLMTYRIYDIFEAEPGQTTELTYEDPKTGEEVTVVQDGRLTARVRGYLLWIIPFQHFSVSAATQE